MSRPVHEVAHIINSLKPQLPGIVSNTWKLRTLYALSRCRTAAMGGHIDRCDNPKCNRLHLSFNSCRNRHCLGGPAQNVKATNGKNGSKDGKLTCSMCLTSMWCSLYLITSMNFACSSHVYFMPCCSAQPGRRFTVLVRTISFLVLRQG